jgi:hypothetical protein|tara:strand:+ start:1690 stop:1968 length:279 start_codon:yes stop_codon:yes gene_type:complete
VSRNFQQSNAVRSENQKYQGSTNKLVPGKAASNQGALDMAELYNFAFNKMRLQENDKETEYKQWRKRIGAPLKDELAMERNESLGSPNHEQS